MNFVGLYAVAVTLEYSNREQQYYLSVEISDNPDATNGLERYIYKENSFQSYEVDSLYAEILEESGIYESHSNCGQRIILDDSIYLGFGYILRDYPVAPLIYNNIKNGKTDRRPLKSIDIVVLNNYGENYNQLIFEEMVRRIIIGRTNNIYLPVRGQKYEEYMDTAFEYMEQGICPPKRGRVLKFVGYSF